MSTIVLSFLLGVAVAAMTAWRLTLRWVRRHSENQRELLRRTRRVEKMAELGTLTGHLAHEIRNPLSTISINLQLLSEDITRLGEELKNQTSTNEVDSIQQRYNRQLRKISTITGEVERVTNTLNDFLRYAGQMELHPAEHDINELLDDLIDFYEPQASVKHVQIRRSLGDGKAALCRIDKDLIKQAFLNLFINATQIMDQGGELIIRSKLKTETVLIEVTDTGPGIARDKLEKVFDPYYTTRAGGTGLGLPTCRRIIEEHNGRIDLHSDPGKGTSFTIELPLLKKLI